MSAMLVFLVSFAISIIIPIMIARWAIGAIGLHKSTRDRKIFGICGGVAETLHIDSSLVRVLWVVAVLFFGVGLGWYIVFAIFFPTK